MELERELKSAYEEFALWKNLLVQTNANIVGNTYGLNGVDVNREKKLAQFISMKAAKAFENCLDLVEQIRNEDVPLETIERISNGN